MNPDTLARLLHRPDIDLELVATTASTNADLVLRARAQVPLRPILRVAQVQSAGRGRLGRTWHATPGGALLFSVALPWHSAPAQTPAVTLACGLAAAQVLRAHAIDATVKWPNDILLGVCKLAGILTEIVEAPAGERTLVVGMGLNLYLDAPERSAIGHPAADLAQCLGREEAGAQREYWLALLAAAITDAALQFDATGFGPLQERFNACLAFRDQTVQLFDGSAGPISGIARGVDAQGRLLVESAGRPLAVASGEMRMRADAAGMDAHTDAHTDANEDANEGAR